MAGKKALDKQGIETASFFGNATSFSPWGNPETLTSIRQKYQALTKEQKIARALEYRRTKSLIQQLIDVIVDFASAGFEIELTSTSKDKKEEIKKHYNDLNRNFNLDKKVIKIIDLLVTCHNAVLLWHTNTYKEIEWLKILSPNQVEYKPAFGGGLLYLKLSNEFRQMVNYPDQYFVGFTKEKIAEEMSRIPDKYKTAAKKLNSRVLMNEDDGDHWKIITLKEDEMDGFEEPGMQAIFEDIELWDMLKDGDWTTAFHIKYLIQQVSAGEPTREGQKPYPLKSALVNIEKEWKKPNRSLYWFTDWTQKAQFIFPDPTIWSPNKYEAVENRILRWAGISLALIQGTGGTYSVGYLNIKRLIAKVNTIRRIVKRALEEFYREPSVILEESDRYPSIKFDEQMLKEPRQLLDQIRFLVQQGLLDNQSALEGFGYEARDIKERKQEERKAQKDWLPLYNSGTGLPVSMDSGQERLPKGNKGRGGSPTDSITPQEPEQKPKPATASKNE